MWTAGVLHTGNQSQTGVRGVLDPNGDVDEMYGFDPQAPMPSIDDLTHISVPETRIILPDNERNHLIRFIPRDDETSTNYFIDNFTNLKNTVTHLLG